MSAADAASWSERLREERIAHNWRQQEVADRLGTSVVSVKRWERGTHRPSLYFRVKLCTLFGKSAEELGFVAERLPSPDMAKTEMGASAENLPLSSDFPECWNVPTPRNPFFVGREEILNDLHERFRRVSTMILTISGLDGIGKTQVALEYAYRYRRDYHAVFWTNAATQDDLQADILAIAERLGLSACTQQDQDQVLKAVKHWFATHHAWLWILDNADDIAMVHEVIPAECLGHVLLTSRAQALGVLAQRIELETMGLAEGSIFLLRRAKLLAPDAFLDSVQEDLLAAAEAIVLEMDFLPLALDQAGAYIDDVGCSLSAYLELYRAHRQDLLQHCGQLPTAHPEPIATTWSLSFHKVEQANPAAADLLRLCAFLEPDAIPEELIGEGSTHFGPVLNVVAGNALLLNEAIKELRKVSLIQRDPESRMLRVHRLVQAVLRDSMEVQEQCCWAERAVRAVNAAFPEYVERATWPRCQRYLPQAQACSLLIQEYTLTDPVIASLLVRVAAYVEVHALYEQAEWLYQHAVRILEQSLGPKDPRVVQLLNNLAALYREQGKNAQAEHALSALQL